MKNLKRMALALALSGLALPGFAGGFTGLVTFDKATPSYNMGELVKMDIHGIGVCKDFNVNWGDGQITNIINYDFDASNHVLEHQHKYLTAAGNLSVTVSDVPGKPLSAQCGSRSSGVTIVPNGIVTSLAADKGKVQPGETIMVTVNGSGICAGLMTIYYNTQPAGSVSFPRNAPWPRQAPFKFSAEGDYYFTAYAKADAGFDPIPCSYTTDKTPVKVEVKKAAFVLNPALAIPTQMVHPVGPTQNVPVKPVGR